MDDLIQALTIFRKYTDTKWPTNCEHDKLRVMVDPEKVSEEDKDTLGQLGFLSDYVNYSFYSGRFGSC